jgi:hypothetical protein
MSSHLMLIPSRSTIINYQNRRKEPYRGAGQRREDRGRQVRNSAILDPTGTPTSSATGLHLAAIR